MVELSSYKALFIQTTQEYLQILLAQLEVLKVNPTDQSALTEAHRMVHTIKSRSMLMGYIQLGELCKDLEELFFQAMNKTRVLDAQTVSNIEQMTERMLSFVDGLKNDSSTVDLSNDIQIVQSLIKG